MQLVHNAYGCTEDMGFEQSLAGLCVRRRVKEVELDTQLVVTIDDVIVASKDE